jgi:hypothetical protein
MLARLARARRTLSQQTARILSPLVVSAPQQTGSNNPAFYAIG